MNKEKVKEIQQILKERREARMAELNEKILKFKPKED